MKFLRCVILFSALPLFAADIRPVPPPGVEVPTKDREELQAGLQKLGAAIDRIRSLDLAADVEIFHKAVRYAVDYNEILRPEEIGRARELLKQGMERADALSRGQAPWTAQTGLVVRGYVSQIDKSVQPYGLVVPPSYSPHLPRKWRLDPWFHGRSETLTELNFLYDRQRQPGEFTPRDTFVLHLYGRYCNANKLAGEIDLFEALADVKKHYAIDDDRIVIRGFSMGGAAVWHFAAHYAGRWAAAAPGAGFSETPAFLRVFQNEVVQPTPWEKKLWHMYDATDYAANFYNLPLVAYSGEIDRQKQAADIMDEALTKEGLHMTHIIGPQTPHRYHPDSKIEIDRRLDAIAARGRDPYPRKLKLVTYTLRYNRMKWARIDGMAQHWERARLDAEVAHGGLSVKTENVSALSLLFGPGAYPLDPAAQAAVEIDGQTVNGPTPETDRSWTAHFRKDGSKWVAGEVDGALRKRHGLQGPIDDAFLSSFIFVTPTGQPMAGGVAKWVESEQKHAIKEWRSQFRGDAQVKPDTEISQADIASSNLVLWGDPGSNQVLKSILAKLPLNWSADAVTVAGKKYSAATHAPMMIFPNPLNPRKYVVLNSGFTFREYDYLNNARQVPKLPDWAVVDTTTPPNERYPGKIAAAGFFGEKWETQ